MTNAITQAQADIVGENLVVLTLTCANPSSAANVFASLKEELIAGRFRIGPYGLVDPKVERDERPAIETRVTMTEVDVVCHIDRRGFIRFDAECPKGHFPLATGPESRIRAALEKILSDGGEDIPRDLTVGHAGTEDMALYHAQNLAGRLKSRMINDLADKDPEAALSALSARELSAATTFGKIYGNGRAAE